MALLRSVISHQAKLQPTWNFSVMFIIVWYMRNGCWLLNTDINCIDIVRYLNQLWSSIANGTIPTITITTPLPSFLIVLSWSLMIYLIDVMLAYFFLMDDGHEHETSFVCTSTRFQFSIKTEECNEDRKLHFRVSVYFWRIR